MIKGLTLREWLYKYKFHHILMWVLYYAFFFVFYKDYYPSAAILLMAITIYFVFNAAAFYIIGYFLFPRFLNKNKYILFFLLSGILLLALCVLLTATLYAFFWDYIPKEMASLQLLFQLSLISVVPLAGLMSGGKLIFDRIKYDRHNRTMDQQRLESELQYLKAQVNPHFLFNAINSVYFLIKKDPNLAAETLIKLSDLLRFQLYDCSDEKIAIEKELEYLQNFISLEKIRKGEKVSVDFRLTGNLSGFQIAPFLLIPFLENAFKYVSTKNDHLNQIEIHLDRQNNIFTASFTNSTDHNIKNEVGGIGHKNVKRRLDLLYQNKHELKLTDSGNTYKAVLTLEIE
ncbi:MAG: histidine kinase [Cyclobacteriaceae bacterium]|nr:histidine kinase [Cyclobacteriaceae bacterium]